MKLIKRIAVVMLFTTAVTAHAWPMRPVRIIVPSSAGAAPDNMIRLIATRLAPELKQPVVIENRVGVGGIAAKQAFDLANDDHTFLLTLTSTTAVAPLVFKAASKFNYLDDTQPVMIIGESPFMVVAYSKSKAKTLGDLVTMAREKPGAVPFATPPPSSIAQLSVTVLCQATNTKFNLIPFSRSNESLTAVSSGDVEFMVDAVSVVRPFVDARRVRPIAVLSATKLPGLEKFPLASETVPGLEISAGFGLVFKKDADPAIGNTMYQAVLRAVADAELRRKLQDMAIFVRPGGADAYRATLLKESEFWGKVIRLANIKPE